MLSDRLDARQSYQPAIWASAMHDYYELLCSCYGYNHGDFSDQRPNFGSPDSQL